MSSLACTDTAAARNSRRFRHPFQAAFRIAGLMLARWRERRDLASFDAHMLRDIGVTPYEAGVEARKPFWQP